MGFTHHSSLIDGSVLITPFLKLEPAPLHIDIVYTPDDGEACKLFFSHRIG